MNFTIYNIGHCRFYSIILTWLCIEQYLDYSYLIHFNYDWYFKGILEITPTELVFKNGTTKMIYESSRFTKELEYRPNWYAYGDVFIVIGPKKVRIVESETYVPKTSPRLLNSDSESTLMNTKTFSGTTTQSNSSEGESKSGSVIYRILSLMSQIGGFAYFIKLVFGTLLGFFYENFQVAEFVNMIKFTRHVLDKKQARIYNSM